MVTNWDTIHIIFLCSLDFTALLANGVLVFAILTRTPQPMRSYSILLLNNCFVDICSAIVSAMGVARLIYQRDFAAELYVFIGPCSYIGHWACFLCQSIHTYFVCHSALVLLHSFCFRLYILRDHVVQVEVPSSLTTASISMLLYIPTVAMLYTFYTSSEQAPHEVLRILHLEQYTTIWNPDLFNPRFFISISYLCLVSPITIVILFFVRRKLIQEIKKMETGKKDYHSSIATALTYQLLLPAGQAVAVSTWLLNVANIWPNEIAERLIMIINSLFALGSPLINLTFLPPYRRMFSMKSTTIQISPSFTTQMTSVEQA